MTKPIKSKKDRKPTWTSLAVEAMRKADDFMSLPQLCEATGASKHQMESTLTWLATCGVAEATPGGGRLWWSLTYGHDKRNRVIVERVEEPEGNRGGKPKRAKRFRTHDAAFVGPIKPEPPKS